MRQSMRQLICILLCVWVTAFAADEPTGPEPSAKPSAISATTSELRARALAAIDSGNNAAAIAAAEAMVAQTDADARTIRVAADVLLRAGEINQATQWFDRYLEIEPDDMPYLWQRGIALYFAGQHEAAAKQFEAHRKVNPNDVENAAWHYLCVAKAQSPQQAKAQLLPAPNDSRIPMNEVLQMLAASDPSLVTQRLKQLDKDSAQRESAVFYGEFYLGLYADANGDQEQAPKLLASAAKSAPHNYMGDVARVYAKWLSAPK